MAAVERRKNDQTIRLLEDKVNETEKRLEQHIQELEKKIHAQKSEIKELNKKIIAHHGDITQLKKIMITTKNLVVDITKKGDSRYRTGVKFIIIIIALLLINGTITLDALRFIVKLFGFGSIDFGSF